MKKEDIQNEIKAMFPKLLKENLMAFSNMVVPQHRHNKVDSPAVNSFDINTSNSEGFIFPFASGVDGSVKIFADYPNNLLYIGYAKTPPDVSLQMSSFKNIFIEGSGQDVGDNITLAFDNGTDASGSSLDANLQQWVASGDFAIQLPDTTRPTAVPGMIAYEAGQFYYCVTAGVWTPF